jgi:transcriptional regulator with XRE-family HTH domain
MAAMDYQDGDSARVPTPWGLSFLLVTAEGWRRLGELVRQERFRRGRTQKQFGAELGMSPSQVANIENAYLDRYNEETHYLVDVGMGWQQGSMERVSKGLDPIPETDPASIELRDLWQNLTPEQRELALRMLRAIRETPEDD